MSFDLALIDSDLSMMPDGTIRTVTRTDKLKQDIIKIILTPVSSVKYHPWYGSAINEGTIGEVLPDSMLFQDITTAIQESLSKLQTLQRAQASGQKVELSEILASINDIQVQRKYNDPRQVNVIVIAMSKDFTAVEEIFMISS
jgi:phage baseplate assembly protein W